MQSSQNIYIKMTASDGHSHSRSWTGLGNRNIKALKLDSYLPVFSQVSQCAGVGVILCLHLGLFEAMTFK